MFGFRPPMPEPIIRLATPSRGDGSSTTSMKALKETWSRKVCQSSRSWWQAAKACASGTPVGSGT